MKWKATKKNAGMKAAKAATAGTPLSELNIQDDGNGNYTVLGADKAGNQFDVSALASLTATSDNEAAAVAAATGGMSFSLTAATPPPAVGDKANITLTATWNDPATAPAGSPFSITLPSTIQAGTVAGIVVVALSAP